MEKPRLSGWQIVNMSVGFFGIQFGWNLKLSNMSAIYEYLGASANQLPLLWLAAATFMVSSVETLLAQLLASAVDENVGSILLSRARREARVTIQTMGSARNDRSQAPHAAKVVGSSPSATSSTPTSIAPKANEIRP